MVEGNFEFGFGPLKGKRPVELTETSYLTGLTYYVEGHFHNELQMKGIMSAYQRLKNAEDYQKNKLLSRYKSLMSV